LLICWARQRSCILAIDVELRPAAPILEGPPERFRDAFNLTKQKNGRTLTAVCELWSHEFGWELRLMIDGHGLQMSSVVRSDAEMVATVDQWRAAMLEKGWRSEPDQPDTTSRDNPA
jgi:hypothetical protein